MMHVVQIKQQEQDQTHHQTLMITAERFPCQHGLVI